METGICDTCINKYPECGKDFNRKIVISVGVIECDGYRNDIKNEKVDHPSHYNQSGIETIEAIKSATGDVGFEGYCVGNIVKYVSRYKYKNGLEDLKKALWHIKRLITEVENDGNK